MNAHPDEDLFEDAPTAILTTAEATERARALMPEWTEGRETDLEGLMREAIVGLDSNHRTTQRERVYKGTQAAWGAKWMSRAAFNDIWRGICSAEDDSALGEEEATAGPPPPLTPEEIAAQRAARRAELEPKVASWLKEPRPLDALAGIVRDLGVVGERHNIRAIILTTVTRACSRPVSAMLGGDSSTGKSTTVRACLRLLPKGDVVEATNFTEAGLFNRPGSFAHKVLYLPEASILQRAEKDDATQVLIRELVETGNCTRLKSVESENEEGLKVWTTQEQTIEGPVSLITTSTTGLQIELDTRVIILRADDTTEQNRAVLGTVGADLDGGEDGDDPATLARVASAQDFLEFLALGATRARVPFAPALMEELPATTPRVRRDARRIGAFVQAHAMLMQSHRQIDERGRIIAEIEDYEAIYPLLVSVIVAAGGAPPVEVRRLVEVIAEEVEAQRGRSLNREGSCLLSVRGLCKGLGVSSTATMWSRVNRAIELGLIEREVGATPNAPSRFSLGPVALADLDSGQILPHPDVLRMRMAASKAAE